MSEFNSAVFAQLRYTTRSGKIGTMLLPAQIARENYLMCINQPDEWDERWQIFQGGLEYVQDPLNPGELILKSELPQRLNLITQESIPLSDLPF